jgi:5-bromo-4-chloroindolyl phosphate hydrolysis protein
MKIEYKEFLENLNKILEKVKDLDKRSCNDYSIRDLESLIEDTYQYSRRLLELHKIENSNSVFKIFENNVRQTKEKQLHFLRLNRSKPKKRLSDWDDTIRNFRQDLTNSIYLIESSEENSESMK